MTEEWGGEERLSEKFEGGEGRRRVEISIALRYLPGLDEAPLVLVNGQGEIARAIVELARSLRIPIVRESNLSEHLLRVPPGHPIPPDLYEAVAVILAALFVETPQR